MTDMLFPFVQAINNHYQQNKYHTERKLPHKIFKYCKWRKQNIATKLPKEIWQI